jgi:hypothetical protein
MSTLRTETLQTLDDLNSVAVEDLADLYSPGGVVEQITDFPVYVTSVAALRLVDKLTKNKVVTTGYYTTSDGGGGTYYLDAADTTSPDNGSTVIVGADGGRWKLSFTNYIHIKQAGALGGSDISAMLNTLGTAMYNKFGGTIEVGGTYTLSTPVNLYPNVYIKGEGSGRNTRVTATHSGTAFVTTRPVGYVPLCIGARLSGLTIVGTLVGGEKVGIAIDMKDCMQCEIFNNEIANFETGIRWNVGHTPELFVQAFFNRVYQNIFKPVTRGHVFGGAANRNTFELNSYADNLVAYDFAGANNWSETNTFINENIEGCHSWAEWSGSVYSQTWIGICIENPASNGYVCSVKDPGRQVFVNLSMIPLGNPAAIVKFDLVPGVTSMVLGSAASSGSERLGTTLNENVKLYNVLTHYTHQASGLFSGTINAGAVATMTIPLPGALLNDRVDIYALRTLSGCSLQAYTGADVVNVVISNGTASNITIPSTEISAILRRVG